MIEECFLSVKNNYRYYSLFYLIVFANIFSTHKLLSNKPPPLRFLLCSLHARFSHTFRECDPTAPKHSPRTRIKAPAQRRPLTCVLYPWTTVHRHSLVKPLASIDRTRTPHEGQCWHGDARPDVDHLLSVGGVEWRRDHHSTELKHNFSSLNWT